MGILITELAESIKCEFKGEMMQATAEDLADVFKKVDTAARKGRWQKPRGNMLFFPQTGT